MSWLANVAVGAAVLLGGIATILFVVGLLAYSRLKNGKLLWVSIAFLFLAIQGIVLAWLSYQDRGAIAGGNSSFTSLALVGLGIVLALYFAVLKR